MNTKLFLNMKNTYLCKEKLFTRELRTVQLILHSNVPIRELPIVQGEIKEYMNIYNPKSEKMSLFRIDYKSKPYHSIVIWKRLMRPLVLLGQPQDTDWQGFVVICQSGDYFECRLIKEWICEDTKTDCQESRC